MSSDFAFAVLIAVVMVIGLAGTLLPILPGLWLIWAAALGYVLVESRSTAGLVVMVVLTILAVGGTAAAVSLPQRQAAGAGVPVWGQVVAAGAAVAGMMLIPVIGALIGFAAGIFTVTVLRTRELAGSVAASMATIRGMLYASGAQFAIGLLMIVIWLAWVVFG